MLRSMTGAALLALAGPFAAAASDSKASKFYEDALTRFEKKDLDGAIVQLKNALQIDKSMLSVQLLLGKALLGTGDPIGAEVAFLEAIRLGVNRAEVVLPLMQVAILLGKQKEVADHPNFSVSGLPVGVQIPLWVAKSTAAMDLGDMRGAMRAIEEARVLDPSRADSWLAEVPLRIRQRQFQEAVIAADKALQLAPKSAEAVYQRGSIDHVAFSREGAVAAYTRALAMDAKHLESRLARAGLYVDMGRFSDARKDVNEAQLIAPEEPRASYLKALLAERDGDQTAATAALRAVTELIDPIPVEYIRYRPQQLLLNGLAHYGLSQREKAKPYLEMFQSAQGNSAVAKLLANIYLSEKNADRAVEVLETYLRTQAADAQAITLLAVAHMAKGRYAKATSLMQQALSARDLPEFRTVLGLGLMRSGQREDAASQLEVAWKKDPGQLQAGTALVVLYMQSGRGTQAVQVAEALVKQQPANPVFLNLLGLTKARRNDASGAKAAFEKAISLDASLDEPKINLAKVEISSGALDSARARLNVALQANEKNVEALLAMSAVSEKGGQRADTVRWLTKAIDVSAPDELRPALALVDLHLRSGQAEPALEVAKALNAKAPSNLGALMAFSRVLLAVGDFPGARVQLSHATRIAAYDSIQLVEIALLQISAKNLPGAAYSLDKALKDRPEFLPALALMADVELRQGDAAKAEQRARQILQKYPQRALGYGILGDIASSRGQWGPAADFYRKAYQLEPSSETLLRLFRTLSGQGDNNGAVALAEQWLKTRPKDVDVRKSLARGFVLLGQFVSAKSQYEETRKLSPTDAEVLNDLANVLAKLNDPMAGKVAEQGLAAHPGNAALIDTAGWIAFRAGRQDRALHLLRDARLRSPGNPEIRYHLAAALAKAGRTGESREELEAALKGGRSFDGAAEAAALLRTLK